MGKLVDNAVEFRLDADALNDMKGVSFELNSEKIDTTNMDAQGWERIKASKKDLKINVNGNFDKSSDTTVADVIAFMIGKTKSPYTILYKTAAVGQRESITGTLLVETWSLNMNDGEDVQWSVTLQNSGDPTVNNKAA